MKVKRWQRFKDWLFSECKKPKPEHEFIHIEFPPITGKSIEEVCSKAVDMTFPFVEAVSKLVEEDDEV